MLRVAVELLLVIYCFRPQIEVTSKSYMHVANVPPLVTTSLCLSARPVRDTVQQIGTQRRQ
jgi:hypothetical protein